MRRVPRPNVRKRKGRAARQAKRAARRHYWRFHPKEYAAAFLERAIPLIAKATCEYMRIYEEESKRFVDRLGKPPVASGRSMRIPFMLGQIRPSASPEA